jgi:hypothetical protein
MFAPVIVFDPFAGSFAAAFGGVIPGLGVPPAGVHGDDDREKAAVVR